MRKFMTKRVYIALSVVAVLAITASAIAYFTDSGTGTGNGTVGTSGQYTVAQTGTNGVMLPGSGTSVLSFSITNPNAGEQFASVVKDASVKADSNGDIVHGATSVAGCKANWFHIDASSIVAKNLVKDDSTTGSVTVSMPSNATTIQDACKNASPDVNYTVG